jgi:hypothetical protein
MMMDEAATHKGWMNEFPEENYYFLDIPGQCTRWIQPLDSGPAFGHVKSTFRTPGMGLKQIVNVLVHFPVWVGSRLSMWRNRFKKLRDEPFPWEELCGEEEEEAEELFRERYRITTAHPIGEDIDSDGDILDGADSWAGSEGDSDSDSGPPPPKNNSNLLAANRARRAGKKAAE